MLQNKQYVIVLTDDNLGLIEELLTKEKQFIETNANLEEDAEAVEVIGNIDRLLQNLQEQTGSQVALNVEK